MVTRSEEVGIYGRFGEHVKNGVPGGGGGGYISSPNLLDNGAFEFWSRHLADLEPFNTTGAAEQWYPSYFDRWQVQGLGGSPGIPELAPYITIGGEKPLGNAVLHGVVNGGTPPDEEYLPMHMAKRGPSSQGSGFAIRQIHRNILQMARGGDFVLSFYVYVDNAAATVIPKYVFMYDTTVGGHSTTGLGTVGLSAGWNMVTIPFTINPIADLFYDTSWQWPQGYHIPETYWGIELQLTGYGSYPAFSNIKLERGTGRTPFIYDSLDRELDWRRCKQYFQQSGGSAMIGDSSMSPMRYKTGEGWGQEEWLCSKDLAGSTPLPIKFQDAIRADTYPRVRVYASKNYSARNTVSIQGIGTGTATVYYNSLHGCWEVEINPEPKSSKRVYYYWTMDNEIYVEGETHSGDKTLT